MKHFISTIFSFFGFYVLISCAKSDVGADTAPTNLALATEISTDGSGTVVFTATAEGAVTYDFEYGNGEAATAPSGIVTYKYTQSGTNTYSVIVMARSSSGLSAKKTVDISVTVNPVLPVLYWADEFNTDGVPDPTKWGYDIGTGSGGWGNQELEYYTNRTENVTVQNGKLKIKAIKENYSGSTYTSARLLSKGLFSFKYGKVEIRAKLPEGVGTWPALWMLGNDVNTVGWPACGEIDIMEHRGNELNKIFGTLHYPGRSGGNANGATKVISNATTDFHIYSIEWSASAITISVDNQAYHTVANTSMLPFNHDFFLILNVAMGGTFGGSVNQGFTNATMEVDYVRVYK
jgi:beta-glucanase (GH16 family)